MEHKGVAFPRRRADRWPPDHSELHWRERSLGHAKSKTLSTAPQRHFSQCSRATPYSLVLLYRRRSRVPLAPLVTQTPPKRNIRWGTLSADSHSRLDTLQTSQPATCKVVASSHLTLFRTLNFTGHWPRTGETLGTRKEGLDYPIQETPVVSLQSRSVLLVDRGVQALFA